MAGGVARAGVPLKSTGRRTITTSKQAGDSIATAKMTALRDKEALERTRSIENKPLRGPVAGYTESEIQKSDIEIIDESLRGERISNQGYEGRFSGGGVSHAAIAGQKLTPENAAIIAKEKEYQAEQEQIQAHNAALGSSQNKLRGDIAIAADNPPIVIPQKPMGGLGFYFVLMIVVVKDLIDIIWEIIEFFADVTVVLGIIMWCISTMMDIIVLFSTGLYFFLEGMPFTGQRKKVQIVSALLEFLPIVGFLPLNSIAFVWIRFEENRRRKEEARQKQEEALAEFEQEKANIIATYERLEDFRETPQRPPITSNNPTNTAQNVAQRAGNKLQPKEIVTNQNPPNATQKTPEIKAPTETGSSKPK